MLYKKSYNVKVTTNNKKGGDLKARESRDSDNKPIRKIYDEKGEVNDEQQARL